MRVTAKDSQFRFANSNAYFSTFLGSLNYSAGLTEIIRAEGYDKGAAGLIGTAFFCSYGIGQLFSGFMGDRWKPQKMIFPLEVKGSIQLSALSVCGGLFTRMIKGFSAFMGSAPLNVTFTGNASRPPPSYSNKPISSDRTLPFVVKRGSCSDKKSCILSDKLSSSVDFSLSVLPNRSIHSGFVRIR